MPAAETAFVATIDSFQILSKPLVGDNISISTPRRIFFIVGVEPKRDYWLRAGKML